MKDKRPIKEKIIDFIEAELDDCWSTQKVNYIEHDCNGQDGNDRSYTKKTFESVFIRAREQFLKNETLYPLK